MIVQVIGETIAAIKLASAEKWDQLWTDATTQRQCPFQALIIGLMDSEKKLDPVTVSSCIFLEDETAETTVESILAKVSGISKGFASKIVASESTRGVASFRATTKIQICLLLPTTRRIFSSVQKKPYCQYSRR